MARRKPGPQRPSASQPASLDRVRWKGEGTYRVLSYYFEVRWNWDEAGRYIQHVLERFAVPPDPAEVGTPPWDNLHPRYSIVAAGRGRDRRYRLFFGDRATIGGGQPSSALQSFFWHVNSQTIRLTGDFLLIHAGALATPGGEGVLIVGAPRSGKSTLTTALVRAGFGYLSDDAGPIDPVTRRLYPYPKAITLKERRFDLFPELEMTAGATLMKTEHLVVPEEIRPGCIAGPCPVRFIFFHRYEPGATTTLTPLSRADGLVQLGLNTLNLPAYGGRGITLLAEVASQASHFSMVSGSLQEAVRTVSGVVGSPLDG